MSSCLWACVATFFVGLAVGAAGMAIYSMFDDLHHYAGD